MNKRSIPVICVQTGAMFESIRIASEYFCNVFYLGKKMKTISEMIRASIKDNGRIVKGYGHSFKLLGYK